VSEGGVTRRCVFVSHLCQCGRDSRLFISNQRRRAERLGIVIFSALRVLLLKQFLG